MKRNRILSTLILLSVALPIQTKAITEIPTGLKGTKEITQRIELKILLVQFTDVRCRRDCVGGMPRYTKDDFENLLGSQGSYVSPKMFSPDGDEVFGSLSDYFKLMSGAQVSVHASVINSSLDGGRHPLWLTLPNTKQYYHDSFCLSLFDDGMEAGRKAGLDVSTSSNVKMVILYAGNTWMGGGLNPNEYDDRYTMSEVQGRPYGQEGSYARFSRIGLHCHEFAHTLGIGHCSGSRADLMESGTRNGSIEGNAPAPLNAIARMRLGWATVISIPDSSVQTIKVDYSLTDPVIVKLTNNRGDVFLVENRRFDQTMKIGQTEVPDYNNRNFLPLAWPHGAIVQGILVWRINAVDHYYVQGYSSEGLIYASRRYGRTYPENTPSETDDGVPFPGVSNNKILSPTSDPRDPDFTESNYFDSTRSHYSLFVPNTRGGSNVAMEIINEDRDHGSFLVRFSTVNCLSQRATAVEGTSNAYRDDKLFQNYPNPFNPTTTIRFKLSSITHVNLTIFDALGKQISALVNEERPAGSYAVQWNASNLPSGIYFCRIQTGNFAATSKMMLVH